MDSKSSMSSDFSSSALLATEISLSCCFKNSSNQLKPTRERRSLCSTTRIPQSSPSCSSLASFGLSSLTPLAISRIIFTTEKPCALAYSTSLSTCLSKSYFCLEEETLAYMTAFSYSLILGSGTKTCPVSSK